jgi:hypothetical protein
MSYRLKAEKARYLKILKRKDISNETRNDLAQRVRMIYAVLHPAKVEISDELIEKKKPKK